MARAVWSGAISFGLVNVPVKAYTAVREHTVHFHQLDKKTGARIRYEKHAGENGREVSSSDIEMGYELDPGRYVRIDPDELAKLRPRTTRTIDVGDFVPLEEIDPIYYANTYWLVPDEDAARAYRLLLAAMEERRRVGIGTVVMRNKQYLAAIRPLDGALAMSTMRFADEVVDRSSVDGLDGSRAKPDAKELKLAAQIVDSLTSPWEPDRYQDTYTEEVHELIRRKAAGEEIAEEPEAAPSAEVTDLMAALQASIERSRGGGASTAPKGRAKGSGAKADRSARPSGKASGGKSRAGTKSTTKAADGRSSGRAKPTERKSSPKQSERKSA
jgi:DNA end-binding protein Ku